MSKRKDLVFVDVSGVDGASTEGAIDALRQEWAPGKVLVDYAFGRHVNDILRDLHPSCLARLASVGQTRWWGEAGNYSIRYIPNRYLDVSLIEPSVGPGWRCRVYDLHSWFGCPRDEAFHRIGQSSSNSLSSLALWLMDRLDDLDMRPSFGWHGPGASAITLMRRHKVAEHNPPPRDNPEGFEHLFRRAYYGGRIQAVQVGACGPSLRYDLRSAYASALVTLPSLQGEWVPVSRMALEGRWVHPWGIYRVKWQTPPGHALTPFPWRSGEGHISYPREGHGWQWGSLVLAALCGPWKVDVEEGWCLVPDKPRERPFGYIRSLHDERLRREGAPEADLLKAVMVSTYGKLAQQGGWNAGKHRSLAWAGMVTAHVQARLLEAALQAPDRVASFLTDGLCLTGSDPLGVNLGKNLGEWSVGALDALWVFQPAFYVVGVAGENGSWAFQQHAAGIPEKDGLMLGRRAVGQWVANGLQGFVRFEDSVYCGMALAQQRGWDQWRTVVPMGREMSLRPAQGFPGQQYFRGHGEDRWDWNTWTPGTDYSVLSHAYTPRGEGLTDGRWPEVEEIRASEECL